MNPAEPQEQIRVLCRQELFDEAADLAATLPDETLFFTPSEKIADHICHRRPAEALRLYEIAVALWEFEGTQATGSGEGLMAVDNMARLREKIKLLRRGGKIAP